MENPNYTSNPVNRCYFCKSELHDTLKPLATTKGYPYVVDGVNADDLQDYRPGIQAAKERGARSLLAEVGISKAEVREISQQLNLLARFRKIPANFGLGMLLEMRNFITTGIRNHLEVISVVLKASEDNSAIGNKALGCDGRELKTTGFWE